MGAYSKSYLDDVVENQGKLFDYYACNMPQMDTKDFINTYMKSKTRSYIDRSMTYVMTMDYHNLWNYFVKNEDYQPVEGESIQGFVPDWIGEFYAYYQWYYGVPSNIIIDNITVDYLTKAYPGLHDLDLELAVKKVGEIK